MNFSGNNFEGRVFLEITFRGLAFLEACFRGRVFLEIIFLRLGFSNFNSGVEFSGSDTMTALAGQGLGGVDFGATTTDCRSFWVGDTGVSSHKTNDTTYI